mgnify:CR=1 FL=1
MATTEEIKPTEEVSQIEKVFVALDERQAAIEERMKCKVFPLVVASVEKSGEFLTGFARVPDITTRFRLIDKSTERGVNMSLEACNEAMSSLIIREESDVRFNAETNFEYWAAACTLLQQFMLAAVPVLKKK